MPRFVVAIAMTLLLALPSLAAAATSAAGGYGRPGSAQSGATGPPAAFSGNSRNSPSVASDASASPRANTSTAVSGSTLPFTGLDLWFVGGAGAALLVAGLGARGLARYTQRPS